MVDPGLGPFYAGLDAGYGREPWSEASARARLEALGPSLPFRLPDGPELVPSNNNDVWRLPAGHLRVAWRGDLGRMEQEARLLESVCAVVPVPQVLSRGRTETLAWSLQATVPGRPLDEYLGGTDGRRLFRQSVKLLRALHLWEPPVDLRRQLTPGPGPVLQRVGKELVILPRGSVLDLVEQTRSAPFADGRVLDELAARVAVLPDLDPSGPVLHGDFYLGNVIVDEGEVTALIDFEFARTGPVDLEVISVVRALDAENRSGVERPPLVEWLQEDYPAAFGDPDLRLRLWLYAISYALRQALFWPADRPEEAGLDPDHPLHTLRRLIDSPLPAPDRRQPVVPGDSTA
jgi:hygromycin-B 7''-O-kinase